VTWTSAVAALARLALVSGAAFSFQSVCAQVEALRPDFQQGFQAAQRADYLSALFHFQVLAAQGHPAAQYNLALMYEHGLGVPRNPTLATHWADKSAAAGYALATEWIQKSEYVSR